MSNFDARKCLDTATTIIDDMLDRDEATYEEPLTIKRSALAWLTQRALIAIASNGGPDGADVEAVACALTAMWPDISDLYKQSLN